MRIEWTHEQEDRRDLFQRFGAEHVAPGASERDETRAFDHDSWKALAAAGFWTAHIPREYGGRGGDLWDFLAGLEGLALGADDSGFVLSTVAHAGLVHVLLEHGTPEQKCRVLGPLLSGAVGATAATEPAGGSHVAAISTRARSDGNGRWWLSGHKSHITNAPVADLMLVVGRLDGVGDRDITLFVVGRGRPGLDTGPHEDLLGQRTSPTGAIRLADVPVGMEDVLGAPGDGLATLYSFLAFDRLMYGIVVASQIEALLPRTVSRTTQRHAFGTAIGNHEFIQDKLVGMRMTVESSRFLAYAAADALMRGDDRYSALASCAKLAASEGAVSSTVELVQIFGHFGYERGNGLERYLRDAVAIRIAGGTTEMQKKNIYKDVARRYARPPTGGTGEA
jgi:isovaleryl-CoA dehydrogenase